MTSPALSQDCRTHEEVLREQLENAKKTLGGLISTAEPGVRDHLEDISDHIALAFDALAEAEGAKRRRSEPPETRAYFADQKAMYRPVGGV